MSFLNFNKSPVTYGAIMYNGPTGTTACYPLFTSQTILAALTSTSSSGAGIVSITNVDDYWTVMPGYKIEVYSGSWYTGTIILTGNNSDGLVPVNYSTTPNYNLACSIKLYFKGTLIDEPRRYATIFNSTTVNLTLTSGTKITVSNYGATSTLTYNSASYRIYEFYAGSTGTFSVSSGSNLNVLCLLIGGGGGGGCFINDTGYTGSGGGGAGAFLTTTVSATPGATFYIEVGAGGAAAALNTSTRGEPGNPTSIISTLDGVALNAGGGGSGGGPTVGQLTGRIGTYFGSTGGTSGIGNGTAIDARPIGTGYAVTSGNAVFTSISAFVSIGGNSSNTGGGGGGGGAGGAGQDRSGTFSGGDGGLGKTWFVTGGSRFFAGGGGGVNSTYGPGGGVAGAGGSGIGGRFTNPSASATANTGSGGSGGYYASSTGKGANGICIIAVPA